MVIASPHDYREVARKRLPTFLFEYMDGGSYDEVTLKRNIADLESVSLRQRVLRDVGDLDLTTNLLGQRLAMPIILGPIGLAGMSARRGECQAARAAQAAGVPFCLSTVSTCPLGEISSAVSSPFWFQLYMMRDRGFVRDLLIQAQEANCTTLIFTVDMPVPGTRYRDYRSGLAGAPGKLGALRRILQSLRRPHWAWDVGVRGRPHHLGNVAPLLGQNTGLDDFLAWMSANFDSTATWRDLEFIRSNWPGALVIKGILDTDDARLALACGADAIVVSNHGGRQLDSVPSTTRALPPIVDAVGSELPVLVDGGVRSGLDIVRMLALGAKGVLLGRAWAFALAAAGEAGVARLLELLEAEMRVCMALTGNRTVDDLGSDTLVNHLWTAADG